MGERLITTLSAGEIRLYSWMERRGLVLLRLSLALVFIWFGLLKPLHLSPAAELVANTMGFLFSPTWFVPVLGCWEIAIGVCLLWRATLRLALLLLFLQLPGTMLPLLLLPNVCWTQFPYGLTVEGQYIIKNLVLLSAGLVLGGTLRYQMLGFAQFASDELQSLLRHGEWALASPGVHLTHQGQPVDRVMFIQAGCVAITVNDEPVAQLGSGHFLGEMSLVTGAMASATTTVLEQTCYIHWEKDTLRALFAEHPRLYQVMQGAIIQDLAAKLTRMDQQYDHASWT
jgi:uncharacterized membrane protein YkgB